MRRKHARHYTGAALVPMVPNPGAFEIIVHLLFSLAIQLCSPMMPSCWLLIEEGGARTCSSKKVDSPAHPPRISPLSQQSRPAAAAKAVVGTGVHGTQYSYEACMANPGSAASKDARMCSHWLRDLCRGFRTYLSCLQAELLHLHRMPTLGPVIDWSR